MICPECGKELEKNTKKCDECGYSFVSENKVLNNKKQINKVFIIIVSAVIFIVFIIGLVIFLGIQNKTNEKNNIVNKYCDGKYLTNVSISDIIDNYSCESYTSYLIDNSNTELSQKNYETLISLDKEEIYQIFYDLEKKDMGSIYEEKILKPSYYKFLIKNKLTKNIKQDDYDSVLYDAYHTEENFDLFKNVLEAKCLEEKYCEWENADYYFGPKFKMQYSSYSHIENAKKAVTTKREYFNEYIKYNKKFYMAYIFDKELLSKTKTNGKIDKDLLKNISDHLIYLTYEDIEQYRLNGGIIYQEDGYSTIDLIREYVLDLAKEDTDKEYSKKLNFLISEAKKDGYDIKYSSALDNFMDSHSIAIQYDSIYGNGSNQFYRKIYRILKNNGFKCYSKCSLEKFYNK